MDDIAKRREARRRKILENSQNRLNRISGVEQKSTRCFPCENHVETPESPSDEVPEVPPQPQPTVVTQTKELPKQCRKTVVSALAVFINILLLILDKCKFETHLNKIFLPLFVYEVTASFKSPHVFTAIRYLELAATIVQDVMVR